MQITEYYRRRHAAEAERNRRKIRSDQRWLAFFLGALCLWLGFLLFALLY